MGAGDIKTVGVTGGSGTIGRMLLRRLGRRPELRLLVLARRPLPELPDNAKTINGSLEDPQALAALAGPSDVVIHLAAKNPGSSEEADRREAADFLAANALGTDLLGRAVRRSGGRLVSASSVAVYELSAKARGVHEENEALPGDPAAADWIDRADAALSELACRFGATDFPRSEIRAFLERHPVPEGTPVYGLSKFLGERRLRGLPHVVLLRISDVYGPGHETRGVVRDALAALLRDETVPLDFGAREKVSFLYMRDVLDAILTLALEGAPGGPTCINVAPPASVGEDVFANSLREAAGQLPPDRVRVARAGAPSACRNYSTERMRNRLGLVQPTPLTSGLRQTLAYLKLAPASRAAFIA